MKNRTLNLATTLAAATLATATFTATAKEKRMELETKWDKTFPKSEKVEHAKITFRNRFGLTLVADCYKPKGAEGRLAAIAVSGPFGAVKEQSSGLYAQTMAEHGFLTIAFDPSFTGESGGEPRDVSDASLNTEDFSAAVDYLSCRDDVDAERIGIIGICGWGGFALNAAAIDTRIKAVVTSTMYDMSRVTPFGYNDSVDENGRYAARKAMSEARTVDYKNGTYAKTPVPTSLPDDAPQFLKDYFAYYAPGGRAYHPRAINFSRGWVGTSFWSLMNMPILRYSKEIRSAVLMIHGEKAHSRYFSEDAFRDMTTGEGAKWSANKRLFIVPGASHTDLYDGGPKKVIPWDEIDGFFKKELGE